MPFSILSHTGDIKIYVKEKSPEALFKLCLKVIFKVLHPVKIDFDLEVKRKVNVKSEDTTTLLIDFLNECLTQAVIHNEIYNEADFIKLGKKELAAELKGYRLKGFNQDIKAVTYHQAKIKKTKDGEYETSLVFDI